MSGANLTFTFKVAGCAFSFFLIIFFVVIINLIYKKTNICRLQRMSLNHSSISISMHSIETSNYVTSNQQQANINDNLVKACSSDQIKPTEKSAHILNTNRKAKNLAIIKLKK